MPWWDVGAGSEWWSGYVPAARVSRAIGGVGGGVGDGGI
jgi:hypothetical protein